jgi:allantoinase
LRLAGREFTSLRLALPSIWTEARHRGFALEDVARWTASNASRAFGLADRKGSILAGVDADFVVFDPDESSVADPDPLHLRNPFAPLDGETLTGRVEATILRGTLIYQSGQFFEHPKGAVVLRLEETQPIQGSKGR